MTLAHADMVQHLIDLESFVTLCYARLDLNKRNLDLVDCGHTGIIHLHGKTGLCEMLHGDNLPLGIREGEIYQPDLRSFRTRRPVALLLGWDHGSAQLRRRAVWRGAPGGVCHESTANSSLKRWWKSSAKPFLLFPTSDRLADDLTCVAHQSGRKTASPGACGDRDSQRSHRA